MTGGEGEAGGAGVRRWEGKRGMDGEMDGEKEAGREGVREGG